MKKNLKLILFVFFVTIGSRILFLIFSDSFFIDLQMNQIFDLFVNSEIILNLFVATTVLFFLLKNLKIGNEKLKKDYATWFFDTFIILYFILKFFFPTNYYIDLIIPIEILTSCIFVNALSKGGNLWKPILVLLLFGAIKGSKATFLNIALVFCLYQYYYGNIKKYSSLIFSIKGIVIISIILIGSFYYIALRSGLIFSSWNNMLTIPLDILTYRLNVFDGVVKANQSQVVFDVSTIQYLKNHFSFIPIIDVSQTLGQFVGCEIDLNCIDHAGALGVFGTTMLIGYNKFLLSSLIFLVIIFFSINFIKKISSKENLIGYKLFTIIAIINIIISGNLDIIISFFFLNSLCFILLITFKYILCRRAEVQSQ